MENNRLALENSATAWLRKRELGPWTAEDGVALAEWLQASTANRITFLRLEAAWEEMGRLKALAAGFPRHEVPTPQQLQLSPIPASAALGKRPGNARRVSLTWSAAALILLAIGAIGVGYWQSSASSYRTPVGGLTSIPLKDGTKVTLNTASRIRVHITRTKRHIELVQGEAFFEVAKDLQRPFIVTADNKTITALGTAFSVRREGTELQVIVTAGKVKFEKEVSAADPGENPILTAGSVVHAGARGVMVKQKPLPEVEETLSWRSGYLVFRDTALPEVIAEFNRYNENDLAIEDPAITTIELTGKFRSTNIDGLVRLLERSFRVKVRKDGKKILLSSQPPER